MRFPTQNYSTTFQNEDFIRKISQIINFLFYNQNTFDPEKAYYVSCSPRFNMAPDFVGQPCGGYHYNEYCVVLERSNISRLKAFEKEFLKYPCHETYERYNSEWSKWPGGNLWYRDVGQAPFPHV